MSYTTINTQYRCSNVVCSYDKPPLDDITLDEFEQFAIDRLHILSELEAALVRNRSYDDLKAIVKAQCEKYMPLHSDTARHSPHQPQRRKDHIGHFVLRLAFCRSCVVHSLLLEVLV